MKTYDMPMTERMRLSEMASQLRERACKALYGQPGHLAWWFALRADARLYGLPDTYRRATKEIKLIEVSYAEDGRRA